MRYTVLGLAGLTLIAACSKPTPPAAANVAAASNAPAPAAAPAAVPPAAGAASVSGTYKADGKAATLAVVSAHKGDPMDGKPVTDLVFSSASQAGSDKPAMDALFGQFGDALVAHVETDDGTLVGTELVHSGFKDPKGSVSVSGPIKLINFHNEGGRLAGEITTGGPIDVFEDKIEIDLTFSVKAPS